jgi:hypothetical protein
MTNPPEDDFPAHLFLGSGPRLGTNSVETTPMTELQAALDRLSTWRTQNADRAGMPEYDKTTVVHRLLTDLIERDGSRGNVSAMERNALRCD